MLPPGRKRRTAHRARMPRWRKPRAKRCLPKHSWPRRTRAWPKLKRRLADGGRGKRLAGCCTRGIRGVTGLVETAAVRIVVQHRITARPIGADAPRSVEYHQFGKQNELKMRTPKYTFDLPHRA